MENKTDLSKQPIRMKEGWVEFTRYPCIDGYIDKWFGDCINNPNNPKQSQMQLNSSAEFYRFNNGKWISRYEFKSGISQCLLHERQLFTSDEIFAYYNN